VEALGNRVQIANIFCYSHSCVSLPTTLGTDQRFKSSSRGSSKWNCLGTFHGWAAITYNRSVHPIGVRQALAKPTSKKYECLDQQIFSQSLIGSYVFSWLCWFPLIQQKLGYISHQKLVTMTLVTSVRRICN